MRSSPLIAIALSALLACTGAAPVGAQEQDRDPWEKMNRKVFAFNDTLDTWLFAPFAKAWRFVLREPVMVSIDNIADNLRTPVYVFNNLVQLKPRQTFDTIQRAILNSTLGVAGIIDIASNIGIEASREDFGQTMARWGVPSGPYVVLPLLGPSTIRDSGGFLVDSPLAVWPFFVNSVFITVSYTAGVTVNTRALLLDEIADAKESALDYYSLARNAYLQRRDALIADREETPDDTERDLYFFDDE
ncbi:MAG: VacJ family lipoprotein [Myxococcales bacterium]|jgi:phospholipid-binding lipoprotein MlaA|nr:MAG: VacJ family lipoprotein [Myxococcales bacterium]